MVTIRLIPPGHKVCKTCNEPKPLEEFYSHKKYKGRFYISSSCIPCSIAIAVKRGREESYYLRKYGLDKQDFIDLMSKQGGCCAICGQPPAKGRKLHVDHDHDTGKVRALLCRLCNVGIGHFRHDPALLSRARLYIQQYS